MSWTFAEKRETQHTTVSCWSRSEWGYGNFPSSWHDVTLLNSTVLLKPVCGDLTYVLFSPKKHLAYVTNLLNPFCCMYIVNKYSSVRGGDLYSYDVNYYWLNWRRQLQALMLFQYDPGSESASMFVILIQHRTNWGGVRGIHNFYVLPFIFKTWTLIGWG